MTMLNASPNAIELQQQIDALQKALFSSRASEQAQGRRIDDLTDFLNNAAEGLHRVAADGTILWANQAELSMLGYSYDEYVGRHIGDFHVDTPAIEEILRRLTAAETLYDEPARLRCKDGSIRHVLIHSNGCFRDGELQYTRCFTRDASERVRRQAAEAQRDALLMKAPVAAALHMGPDHVVAIANRRYVELAGGRVLIGRPFSEAFPELQESDIPALLDSVYRTGQAFESDEHVATVSVTGNTADERHLKFNIEPYLDAAGRVIGLIVIVIDMTQDVSLRRRLESAHEERSRLVDELRLANRAKDDFLAMLGHELRNPISPIVTALELMRLRSPGTVTREYQIIERQVDHLCRLVDDLLDVSRITRGDIELRLCPVSIDQIVAQATEMVEPILVSRQHRLSISVVPDLHVIADPARLAQVMANLLTNAARYTPDNGQLSLEAFGRDGEVCIRLRDNGRGIPPAMLTRIFELFVQGDNAIDRASGGLGIGLAVVRKLVELHGGRVTAASEGEGRGSEFIVCLPRTTQRDVPPDAPVSTRLSPAPRLTRVLLVDDNADAADAMAFYLAQVGCEVKVVYEPIAAIAVAGEFAPDVAVLDIGLPVMDGYELAGRLREARTDRVLPLIAMTGYGQAGDRTRSAAAGFHAHMVKPVNPLQLLEEIDALVATDGTASTGSEKGTGDN